MKSLLPLHQGIRLKTLRAVGSWPFGLAALDSLRCLLRKTLNAGAGTCGIWGRREEAQRSLHETMRMAEPCPPKL